MTEYIKPTLDIAWLWCGGELQILIEGESSFRCAECGWIGWPQKDVSIVDGNRVLRFYPHKRQNRAQVKLL